MFGRPKTDLTDIYRRLAELEARVGTLGVEWINQVSKLTSLTSRVEKRVERLKADEPCPPEGSDHPQRATLQERILRRRRRVARVDSDPE